MHATPHDRWTIILCGGRGSRLGGVTDHLPKPLAPVHDRPILWYTFLTLYKHGFRRFIFPLGYKGGMIETFVGREFGELDVEIRCVQTGESSPIAERLRRVRGILPKASDFFLINGDTFFDFDLEAMYRLHRERDALATLSSVEIVSPYGLLIEREGAVIDFARDRKVNHLQLDDGAGYVNAGIVWLNESALDRVDLARTENFEAALYPRLIGEGRVAHFKIAGDWFPIDTQKDLERINTEAHAIGALAREAKESLSNRFRYRTRYYDDVESLRRRILDKTIVPHQVEVQPPPPPGQPLCWLQCPYCYGRTARDSGERLTPARYVEILRQVAVGGVGKLVFAGHATDPLQAPELPDLLGVALEAGQVFGLYTKALALAEEKLQAITDPRAAPASYVSISVDAGSNQVYNRIHGMADDAPRYEWALTNLGRIAEARAARGAPLDLSATYLLLPGNDTEGEVRRFITDARAAGADLIRFSFPQPPRGLSRETPPATEPDAAPRIFAEGESQGVLERLRPVIEAESDADCQVLVVDHDTIHDLHGRARTLPCFGRWLFPSIGFDGWLGHCSECAAPHFRELSLGNLATTDFWDLYYDYDPASLIADLEAVGARMEALCCVCDRKGHVVNERIHASGVFHAD